MKKCIFFLFCIISSYIATGQEANNELLEVKVVPPKFIYSENEESNRDDLYTFIQENFDFSTPELINFGTVVIRFTVTEEGNVENPKVTNSVDWDVDQALVSAIKKTSGMWRPGYNNNSPVPMQQEMTMMVKTGFDEMQLERLDLHERSVSKLQKGNKLLFDKDAPRRAIKSYNYIIKMFPKEKNTYYLRGLCYYKLGKLEKAEEDWDYYRELGGLDFEIISL